jgi:hypothetical protein
VAKWCACAELKLPPFPFAPPPMCLRKLAVAAALSFTRCSAGGSAYGVIFAADGASAIMLVDEDQPAKETKLLMMLPWVNVYYMHRQEESLFPLFLYRAMSSASLRMGFPMPHSKVLENDIDE